MKPLTTTSLTITRIIPFLLPNIPNKLKRETLLAPSRAVRAGRGRGLMERSEKTGSDPIFRDGISPA